MTPLEELLIRILRRHIRDDDADRSDAHFVQAVMTRFEKERRVPIIDPNE